jgi:hypothetical protein
MRAKILFGLIFALLAGCWVARGQSFIGRPMLPLNASESYFPADAGMHLRWVATDLSATPVTNWTDRIQGSVMSQATAGNRPAWNLTNGVVFDGVDDFLTITNIPSFPTGGQSNWTALVVSKWYDLASGHMLIGNFAGGEIFIGTSSANYLYEGATGGNAIGQLSTNLFDLFICRSTNAVNPYRAYTNGLQGWQGSGGWNNGYAWPRLGRGNGNAPFSGQVHEIIVWTNYFWSAAQIARVHAYATNTYVVTP